MLRFQDIDIDFLKMRDFNYTQGISQEDFNQTACVSSKFEKGKMLMFKSNNFKCQKGWIMFCH